MNFVLQRSHSKTLKKSIGEHPEPYQDYLYTQLKRSVVKRNSPIQDRTKIFIDKISKVVPVADKSILCVGCRNIQEIEYFRSKGAYRVIGIDLFSENPDIYIMDMHELKFQDNLFDIVYSSHSLEHAYNPGLVTKEITRVLKPNGIIAIEVPVNFEPRGADLVDFINLTGLMKYFPREISKLLWYEENVFTEKYKRTGYIRAILKKNL